MTPLVLVHGFLGGGAQWAGQSALAYERPVIALDLPGFGANADMPAINRIEDFASWALTQIDAPRFDLLGHSMGGMIVQDMIRQAPERVNKLVLYGTGAIGVLPNRFEPIETSMDRAVADGAVATANRISATWFLNGVDSDQHTACAEIAGRAQLPAILAGLDAMRNWSGEQHLAQIKSRTQILWGEFDKSYGWPQIEQLWMNIAGSHLAVLPNCAHAVHLERPDLFNTLIGDFLADENSKLG